MKTRILSAISALSFALAIGCAGRVDDIDSESHFLCTEDSDCKDAGSFSECIAGYCVVPKVASALQFESCTLLTDPNKPPAGKRFEGAASEMAECATTRVPAVWSDRSRGSIDLFVKRYPAARQPARGQLWLLHGGPGNPGMTFEPLAFEWRGAISDLDIYMPDHRGTGKSSFAANDTPNLDGFTTTDAAIDLAALIDAARVPSQQVFLLGVGYGTYLAQRYLHFRPNEPTAVILDSAVPAAGADWVEFDKHFDAAARATLALCETDATCSAKLGPDPVARGFEALSALAAQTCPIQMDRATFGVFVSSSYFQPLLLPASIYRILRCNDADRAWFEKVRHYQETPWYSGGDFSLALHDNIVSSELWYTNATGEDVRAEAGTLLAVEAFTVHNADIAATWPRYPRDEYFGAWPASPKPVLVLQGMFNPRMPYGDIVRPHYSDQNQYFVELPRANHFVAVHDNSPMADPDAYGCGWQVIRSFLADPTKPPDTSCIGGMAPLDLSHPPAAFLADVGITDLWENP